MASGSLTQAEVIGGAVVTISGDLSGLRATVADAKRLTMSAGREMKIVATAIIDTRAYEQQIRQLNAVHQRVMQQGMSQRIALAREAGQREGEAYQDGLARAYRRHQGATGGPGGADAGGGFFDRPWKRIAIGAGAGARFAGAGFELAGAYSEASRGWASSDPSARVAATGQMIIAGSSLPLVGSLVRGLGDFSGASAAISAVGDDATRGKAAGASIKQLASDQAIMQATMGGDEIAIVRAQSAKRKREAKELALAAGAVGNQAGLGVVAEEERIVNRQIAKINQQRGERSSISSMRDNAIALEGFASQTRMNGNGESAYGIGLSAQRENLRIAGRERLIGVDDPAKRQLVERGNAQQMAQFEIQAAEQTADRKKAIARDTASAVASEQQASLRLGKQFYAADLAAFDAATKQKLDTIKDNLERQNEARRTAAQRSVIVAQQQEQIGATNAQLRAGGRIAGLQAEGANLQAERESFEASVAAERINVPAENRADFERNVNQRRAALEKTQARTRQRIGNSVNTSIASAGAQGRGEGTLAGVIETIGGIQQEIADADPEVRAQIRKRGAAQLRGLSGSLFAPSSAPSFFDPTRESRGSRGSEDEGIKILRLIAETLRQIEQKGGGLPA